MDAKNYWENRLKKNYSLDGTGHIGLGKHFNNWIYKIKSKSFHKIIDDLNIDLTSTDVIDIGSGTGFYINLWKKIATKNVAGVDITSVAVMNLKKNFPNGEFFEFDIGDKIPSSELGKYGIVSAFDILYHITDDARFNTAIKNSYDLLKPGGYFIFSDNFLHSETHRAERQVSRTLEDIKSIIIKTGFQIVKRKPMLVLMGAPIDSKSKMRKIFWSGMMYLIKKSDSFGFFVGVLIYPLESILISCLNESPTTEIMVCKKL